ncbi:hypothetical protein [Kitasatospora sp. NPDC057223]|uniref:hypothetical protein n=1 Tax=Kitasatospora sp. NPDC057223 TaxID=3346055 RepID=UPI003631B8F6
MLGLGLLLTGALRASRRGRVARSGLRDSRRETAAAAECRDDLAAQRDEVARQRDELMRGQGSAHEETAGARRLPLPPKSDSDPALGDSQEPDGPHGSHPLARRPDSR